MKNIIRNKLTIICSVCATMLLLALVDMPYYYYQIMKWVVCAGALFLAVFIARSKPDTMTCWVFSIVTIAFNPAIPFYFGTDIWQVLDGLTALIFIWFAWRFSKDNYDKK